MTTRTGYALLLGAVVIDSTNNRIRLDEAGVIMNADVAVGTYYLRGDNAASDLALAVKTALESVGANTYDVVVTGSLSTSARPLKVTIGLNGTSTNFRVKWDDGSATFPKRLLGFVNTKAAANTTSEVSTKNPDSAWLSNDSYRDYRRTREWETAEEVTGDGDTSVVRRASKHRSVTIELRFVSALRLFEEDAGASDTDALEHFIDINGDGRPIEIHEVTPDAASTNISNPICDAVTTLDEKVVLGSDAAHFEPRLIQPGMTLYDIDLVLRGSKA